MKFYCCENNSDSILITNKSISNLSKSVKEIIPNTAEASLEKHIPVIKREENNIKVIVGEVLHPMEENHYIAFICLELKDGYMVKYLKPNENSEANFIISEENYPVAVYSYCNLHGLWKKDYNL